MSVSFSTDDLKNKKLLIGTPMYASKCHGGYLHSVLSLLTLCRQIGVQCAVSFICNESLLQRSRNYVVDEFLRSGFTHLIFIDTDIHFKPEDVIALLLLDKDVIGASYSLKEISWNNIIHAVQKNNKIPINHLERIAGHIPLEEDKEKIQVIQQNFDLVETDKLTTGFMMIKRQVFEKLQIVYPEYYYRPDHIGTQHFGGQRKIQMFFSVEIDADTHELTTEYEFFCKLWRNIDGKIYKCPWMVLTHVGLHSFG